MLTFPSSTERMARTTTSGPSDFSRYPEVPAAIISAAVNGESRDVQQMTLVPGTVAMSRRTSSAPDRPVRPASTTTTSGWILAATSTARNPSVTASVSTSELDFSRAYCSWASPSAVSHRSSLIGITIGIGWPPCRFEDGSWPPPA